MMPRISLSLSRLTTEKMTSTGHLAITVPAAGNATIGDLNAVNSLSVTGGAAVTNDWAVLGSAYSARGTATVAGAGSIWTC